MTEKTMKVRLLKECIVAWEPDTSNVRIYPPHLYCNIPLCYYTDGGCMSKTQDFNDLECSVYILNMFVSMVVRDKVDPMAAHNALCGVKEYRCTLAADVPLPKH